MILTDNLGKRWEVPFHVRRASNTTIVKTRIVRTCSPSVLVIVVMPDTRVVFKSVSHLAAHSGSSESIIDFHGAGRFRGNIALHKVWQDVESFV